MNEVTLKARSSSGESYDVIFNLDGDRLKVFCTCQAGVHRKLCKHKLALIEGDAGALHGAGQEELWLTVQAWVSESQLLSIVSELRLAEQAAESASARVRRVKAAIENTINPQ